MKCLLALAVAFATAFAVQAAGPKYYLIDGVVKSDAGDAVNVAAAPPAAPQAVRYIQVCEEDALTGRKTCRLVAIPISDHLAPSSVPKVGSASQLDPAPTDGCNCVNCNCANCPGNVNATAAQAQVANSRFASAVVAEPSFAESRRERTAFPMLRNAIARVSQFRPRAILARVAANTQRAFYRQ